VFSCEAVGGNVETVTDAGVMVALASAGFGIHDDIIDKTSKKHFRKTIPHLFGSANALLAGDLLILKASTMLQEIIRNNHSFGVVDFIKVFEVLYTEICEAEFMGISCRGSINVDLDWHLKMVWKSAADIEVCGRIGAILGNGSAREVSSLAHFCRRIGFQGRLLTDLTDVFNIEGNLPERLKNERIPLAILYAAKSSSKSCEEVQSILAKSTITPTDIKHLLNLCFKTQAFIHITEIAKKTSSEAIHNLSMLRPSPARDMLALINQASLSDICRLCL
jgi:geranylgeranyl pyrophosphate synthase